jgi:hypothetical protein
MDEPTTSNIGLKQLTDIVKSELKSLTGFQPESVISIKKLDEQWKVTIELLERSSIPDKMDILGNYEVLVDFTGDIVSYERKSLRKRGDTGSDEPVEE